LRIKLGFNFTVTLYTNHNIGNSLFVKLQQLFRRYSS